MNKVWRIDVSIMCPYNPENYDLSTLAVDAECGSSIVVSQKIYPVDMDEIVEFSGDFFFHLLEDNNDEDN